MGGYSVNPITWPELESWSRLHRVTLKEWEIEAITGIDAAYRNSVLPDLPEPK